MVVAVSNELVGQLRDVDQPVNLFKHAGGQHRRESGKNRMRWCFALLSGYDDVTVHTAKNYFYPVFDVVGGVSRGTKSNLRIRVETGFFFFTVSTIDKCSRN